MPTLLDQRVQIHGRPHCRFLLLLFAALTVLQLLVYINSFKVLPVSDDFSGPTTDMYRAEAEGPLSLLLATSQPKNYRPLQSLVMWGWARWFLPEPWFAIHVLNFASMMLLGIVMMLWLRTVPLTKVGAVIAGVVLYMHPAMTSQLVSIDNFAALVASALMWLGVLMVYWWRDKPIFASLIALAVLIVAVLFKEYVLGFPLLAALVAVMFRTRRWVSLLIGLIITLSAGVFFLMWVRQHAVLPGYQAEVPQPTTNPAEIAKNLGLLGTLLVYFGHVAWIVADRSALGFASLALSSLVTILALGTGLWRALQTSVEAHTQSDAVGDDGQASGKLLGSRRWALFFALSILPATFPANVLPHVSEMYASAMVVPFAILVGMAAEGVATMASQWRSLMRILFIAQLAFGIYAIQHKINDMRRLGERTARMAQQLDAMLPRDVENQTILAIYLEHQVLTHRHYSIFRMHDPYLLLEGEHLPWTGTFEWLRPGKRIYIKTLVVKSLSNVDVGDHRYAYVWNAADQQFKAFR